MRVREPPPTAPPLAGPLSGWRKAPHGARFPSGQPAELIGPATDGVPSLLAASLGEQVGQQVGGPAVAGVGQLTQTVLVALVGEQAAGRGGVCRHGWRCTIWRV